MQDITGALLLAQQASHVFHSYMMQAAEKGRADVVSYSCVTVKFPLGGTDRVRVQYVQSDDATKLRRLFCMTVVQVGCCVCLWLT